MAQGAGEKLLRKSRILVAPLDWGLGHTTRCIPIVRRLLADDCDVWLAGNEIQEALFRSEFPGMPFLFLEGYNIGYAKKGFGFVFKMVTQMPRIISTIRKEHRWLKRMVRMHHFDGIISDNRFGLCHKQVPSVFMTHQLQIKSPLGRWSETLLRRWNYSHIDRFVECWIPDVQGAHNLAGQLSHPVVFPRVPVKYLGLLSRFEETGIAAIHDHLLLVLSGPEPQRTILENRIIDEVSHYAGTATVVRGLPSSSSIIPSTGMIRFYNHLPTVQLNEEMQKAEWVISRPGYSSVMDILRLHKKSILIPTPGQTEQEYLAGSLAERQIAFAVSQDRFSLSASLAEARKMDYRTFDATGEDGFERVIHDFRERLTSTSA